MLFRLLFMQRNNTEILAPLERFNTIPHPLSRELLFPKGALENSCSYIMNHFFRQAKTTAQPSTERSFYAYILATPVSFAALMTASATTLPTLLSRADMMMFSAFISLSGIIDASA